jgi:hypothetical protein
MKLTGSGLIVGVGLVASVIAIIEFWPSIKKAAAKVGQTAHDLTSPEGSSPLANPVSETVGEYWSWLFKSDAEKKVDAMLSQPAYQLNKKAVVLPDMTKGSYYDLGAKPQGHIYKPQPWIGPAAPDAEYRVDSQNTIVF